MMIRSVGAPDGAVWTIRRHWVARPPRFRWLLRASRVRDWKVPNWVGASADIFDEGFLVVLLALGILAILVFLVIPALIFIVELVLFFALGSLVLFVNSLFRRPWIVEAVREHPERKVIRWRVVGLVRSRRVIIEIAEAVAHGQRHIELAEAELIEEAP